MDESELAALAADVESELAERKEEFRTQVTKDRVSEAICAYANDLPNHRRQGVVFIGLKNDATCANLNVDEVLLNSLADLRTNGNVYPFPTMSVRKVNIRGCDVAVVIVDPANYPPVRYKGQTWIRVGARRAIATQAEEQRLIERRRYGAQPFDVRRVDGATIDDLDLDLFHRTYLPAAIDPETLERNERSERHQLVSLRLMAPDGVPTVVGILTIGKDPTDHLPGAYLQFIRYAGNEITADIRNQKEISGPLPEMLRLLDETLQANISVSSNVLEQNKEIRYPDYPLGALQQIIRNAILHRLYESTNAPVRISWFDNRIEILNPGGPFGQVTVENFGTGLSDYRNPTLAEAMKLLGYVQRFGIGIQLARSELRRNGNPELEFSVNESQILAIVRTRT